MKFPKKIDSNLEFGKEYIFKSKENIFKGIITKLDISQNRFNLIVKITNKSKFFNLDDKTNNIVIISIPLESLISVRGFTEFSGYKIYEDIRGMNFDKPFGIYAISRMNNNSENAIGYDMRGINDITKMEILKDNLGSKLESHCGSSEYYTFYKYTLSDDESHIQTLEFDFRFIKKRDFMKLELMRSSKVTYSTENDALDALENKMFE